MDRSLRHKIEHDVQILHSLVIKIRPSNISSYIARLNQLNLFQTPPLHRYPLYLELEADQKYIRVSSSSLWYLGG